MLGLAVYDKTELTGYYDFRLTFSMPIPALAPVVVSGGGVVRPLRAGLPTSGPLPFSTPCKLQTVNTSPAI